MFKYKHNDLYTESFNEILKSSDLVRNLFYWWSMLVITLIFLVYFWSGMPEWINLIEHGNVAFFVLTCAVVHKNFFFRGLFFFGGFFSLITFFARIGEIL